MNILVLIKQVPASNKVEVDPVTGVLKRNGAASKMNPYDLFAIETALRLKEELGGRVSVLTMGPNQAERVIREAYSLGADEGFLLSDRAFAGADVLATSYALSQAVKKAGDFDLILTGKQTTDGDTAQVGPELAEHMGLPAIANVVEVQKAGEKGLTVVMDMQDSLEVAYIPFPCLVSVDKDLVQPRLPSFRLREATGERKITILTLKDLEDQDRKHYGLDGSPTQVQKIFPPEDHREKITLTGDGNELAGKLKQILKEHKFVG